MVIKTSVQIRKIYCKQEKVIDENKHNETLKTPIQPCLTFLKL